MISSLISDGNKPPPPLRSVVWRKLHSATCGLANIIFTRILYDCVLAFNTKLIAQGCKVLIVDSICGLRIQAQKHFIINPTNASRCLIKLIGGLYTNSLVYNGNTHKFVATVSFPLCVYSPMMYSHLHSKWITIACLITCHACYCYIFLCDSVYCNKLLSHILWSLEPLPSLYAQDAVAIGNKMLWVFAVECRNYKMICIIH